MESGVPYSFLHCRLLQHFSNVMFLCKLLFKTSLLHWAQGQIASAPRRACGRGSLICSNHSVPRCHLHPPFKSLQWLHLLHQVSPPEMLVGISSDMYIQLPTQWSSQSPPREQGGGKVNPGSQRAQEWQHGCICLCQSVAERAPGFRAGHKQHI